MYQPLANFITLSYVIVFKCVICARFVTNIQKILQHHKKGPNRKSDYMQLSATNAKRVLRNVREKNLYVKDEVRREIEMWSINDYVQENVINCERHVVRMNCERFPGWHSVIGNGKAKPWKTEEEMEC